MDTVHSFLRDLRGRVITIVFDQGEAITGMCLDVAYGWFLIGDTDGNIAIRESAIQSVFPAKSEELEAPVSNGTHTIQPDDTSIADSGEHISTAGLSDAVSNVVRNALGLRGS